MRKIAAFLLLSSLALPLRAESDKFKLIHVADLTSELKSSKPPIVCDANNKETREKYGVIPGAILVSSSKKFDLAKALPADKSTPLVFYCANTMCMASHQAAARAVDAGYANVSVMADGIIGWKEAGQPVSQVPNAKKKAAKS